MLFAHQLSGGHLPPYMLSLTFDDGPGVSKGNKGPQTLRLARYLSSQDIYATFFFVGQQIEKYPRITAAVHRLGHLVGNHTFSHPDMTRIADDRYCLLAELDRTSDLIAKFCRDNIIRFRAPYGEWNADIAHYLNDHLQDKYTYRGPYCWDIDAGDWRFWRDGLSATACAEAYLAAIQKKGRGIVLIHDSCDDVNIKKNNRTFEMIRLLVPRLKALGYRFVRLDEIPEIV